MNMGSGIKKIDAVTAQLMLFFLTHSKQRLVRFNQPQLLLEAVENLSYDWQATYLVLLVSFKNG